MQIVTSVTDEHAVKIDFYEGPLLCSIVLDVTDETGFLVALKKSFRDARALQAGFSRDQVDRMNREHANVEEDQTNDQLPI